MTSPSEPLGGVARLYTESLAEHGASSPRAVGWKDEASQRLRFEKLAEVVDPGDGPFAIADFGCGYGAMFDFVAERLGKRLERYIGYEISPPMLEAAATRVSDARVTFVTAARPTETVDYSFASGPFNVKLQASEEEWEDEVRDALRALAVTSRRGLAFNLLTTRVDWREPHLFYADPARFVDFARRELGTRVELLEDYGLYEWTILVRRGRG